MKFVLDLRSNEILEDLKFVVLKGREPDKYNPESKLPKIKFKPIPPEDFAIIDTDERENK